MKPTTFFSSISVKTFQKYFAVALLPAISGMLALQGCYYDVESELYPNTGCDTTHITFQTSIKPILNRNCTSCHTGAGSSGGVDLASHAGASVVAQNGKLLAAVSHGPGASPMPQGAPKLPDCDIAKIRKWVEEGAKNN